MSGKHFFATLADMEPGLRTVEGKWRVKYIRSGFHPTPDIDTYYSAFDLPNLGFSAGSAVVLGPEYYIFPREVKVVVEPVRQHDGQMLYMVEWEQNPSAFLFRLGGWYENRV